LSGNERGKLKSRKDIEKRKRILCKRNEVIFSSIKCSSEHYAARVMCQVLGVSTYDYYACVKRPDLQFHADKLHLDRRAKQLFFDIRQSLGSRELLEKLRKEASQLGRCKVYRLMKTLFLIVTQRLAYKLPTKREYSYKVALKLLYQNFNPVGRVT
jgi:hypothetical protein